MAGGYDQKGNLWSDCKNLEFPGLFYAFLGYDLYGIEEVSRGNAASYMTLFIGPDYKLRAKFGPLEAAKTILEEVRKLVNASQISPEKQDDTPEGLPLVAKLPNNFPKGSSFAPELIEERSGDGDSDSDLTLVPEKAPEGEVPATNDSTSALGDEELRSAVLTKSSILDPRQTEIGDGDQEELQDDSFDSYEEAEEE